MNIDLANQVSSHLNNFPVVWDGKNAILEMREEGYAHWRQMEWIGFYFQFLCEKYFEGWMKIPGPRYGHVNFDGFKEVPWDFKTHVVGPGQDKVIINDRSAITDAINIYGSIGVILASVKASYDTDQSFQSWHEVLKGGKSQYEIARINRGASSRRRKKSVILERITILEIDADCVNKCTSFQINFRNSDGSPRNEKILLDLRQISREIIKEIKY